VRNYSSGLSGYRLRLNREPSIDEIWRELQGELKESDNEVVFCGFGEPTMRLDMVLELTRMIKKQCPHLKVRLNTDGLAQLRNKDREVARELSEAGMDSVSISLNAESQEKYDLLCGPSLEGAYRAVLDFARDSKKYLPEVMLTVVDLGVADLSECKRIAEDLGCEFRVR
jgi:TatD family-associated radical SAM protein